jgi:hypothetical protein
MTVYRSYFCFLAKIPDSIFLNFRLKLIKQIRSEVNQLRPFYDEIKETNEKLISAYASDDTSKIKMKYDRIVTRFNDLTNK